VNVTSAPNRGPLASIRENKPLKAKSALVQAVLWPVVCACSVPSQGLAAPLELSAAPAGTDYRLPAPNVILSVDDSARLAPDRLDTLKNHLRGSASARWAETPGGLH
jgi:hypothetical protein